MARPLKTTNEVTGKQKRHSAEFEPGVALEVRRGELTMAQSATKHGIRQTMVSEWKKQAVEGLTTMSSARFEVQETAKPAMMKVENLHAKIGQLPIKRDFLAKASGR